ncbi:hypothetical protein E2C01_093533 [Portunus trituberculatus]|uniref:Uncharacterized protein n=1 Tax=Portunus trituberculatus TaxID=210409 RepID=A0A5B7JTS8_PORTR|nr:hypothetical protein [Portunus trituberculatus]
MGWSWRAVRGGEVQTCISMGYVTWWVGVVGSGVGTGLQGKRLCFMFWEGGFFFFSSYTLGYTPGTITVCWLGFTLQHSHVISQTDHLDPRRKNNK